MEFDLTKVYSAETAEELKEGDKVLVADSLAVLKDMVKGDCAVETIERILELPSYRFKTKRGPYAFAYLVERGAEKWRPFKDLGELITAWQKKTGVTARANTMPLIWIASKNNNGVRLIAGFKGQFILFEDYEASYEDLFEYYTFLDGTPCGVKE